MNGDNLNTFKYWCHKVLPLVYDDSLSYYELLCKVVKYVNDIVTQEQVLAEEIEQLKAELAIVQKWIADFDTSYAEKVLRECIATMIFVEISDAGYIIYNIPENWSDITFNTVGLDYELSGYNYGTLVLSY